MHHRRENTKRKERTTNQSINLVQETRLKLMHLTKALPKLRPGLLRVGLLFVAVEAALQASVEEELDDLSPKPTAIPTVS